MTRGLGYLQDTEDTRDRKFGTLVAAARSLRFDRPNLSEYRGAKTYQGSTSACVGFALARAIQMSLWLGGHENLPTPSALDLYAKGRRREHIGLPIEARPPLVDVGSYPRLVMAAARDAGFVAESNWPFNPDNVNDDPPPFASLVSYGQRGLDYYRIEGSEEDRQAGIVLALRLGFPVLYGMRVDSAYLHHDMPSVIDCIDTRNIVGGHMQVVLEVDLLAGVARVDNWWDASWGGEGDGTGLVSMSLLSSKLTTDIYAVRAAPTSAQYGGLHAAQILWQRHRRS